MASKITTILSLPPFPSKQELKTLSPSRQVDLLQQISNTLHQVLALSNIDFRWKAYKDFVASYVLDASISRLSSLVFPEEGDVDESACRKLIRKQVLALANRLSNKPGGLEVRTILDIAIVYGSKNRLKVQKLVEEIDQSNSSFTLEITKEVIPAFIHLLRATDLGLHGLRRATYCLNALLQCSPSNVLFLFASNKEFVVTLTECYQSGLTRIAVGYGGLHLNQPDETGWDQMWMECKVALIDSFHVLLKELLQRMNNAANVEYVLDLIFTLFDLSSTVTLTSNSISFFDLPLLADYQQAYSLSTTLASALKNRDDARLDLLESRLRTYDTYAASSSERAGGLKLLLRSSGLMSGLDSGRKGKQKAPPPQAVVDDLEVTRVIDLFPEQSPEYVRHLLALPAYSGNAERVIEGILEGTAPSAETLANHAISPPSNPTTFLEGNFEFTKERRNLFDGVEMKVENITFGKRQMQADDLLRDRSDIELMKADILRRVEAHSDSEHEFDAQDDIINKTRASTSQIIVDDEGLDDDLLADRVGGIRIVGDGEDSDEDDEEEEEPQKEVKQDPQTIVELAYIRDPKLFDRDAATRRSKARAELKSQTGWGDEQLEGWRIMLERNPKKDKILQKHEFSGNQNLTTFSSGNESSHASTTSRGRGGRGRSRGRVGGRGAGRGGSSANTDGKDARERAWKDKNKASHANHNRKSGHDRKMAKGTAGFAG